MADNLAPKFRRKLPQSLTNHNLSHGRISFLKSKLENFYLILNLPWKGDNQTVDSLKEMLKVTESAAQVERATAELEKARELMKGVSSKIWKETSNDLPPGQDYAAFRALHCLVGGDSDYELLKFLKKFKEYQADALTLEAKDLTEETINKLRNITGSQEFDSERFETLGPNASALSTWVKAI